jgi:hypothetical protein
MHFHSLPVLYSSNLRDLWLQLAFAFVQGLCLEQQFKPLLQDCNRLAVATHRNMVR